VLDQEELHQEFDERWHALLVKEFAWRGVVPTIRLRELRDELPGILGRRVQPDDATVLRLWKRANLIAQEMIHKEKFVAHVKAEQKRWARMKDAATALLKRIGDERYLVHSRAGLLFLFDSEEVRQLDAHNERLQFELEHFIRVRESALPRIPRTVWHAALPALREAFEQAIPSDDDSQAVASAPLVRFVRWWVKLTLGMSKLEVATIERALQRGGDTTNKTSG
jgi:hypothetical protein